MMDFERWVLNQKPITAPAQQEKRLPGVLKQLTEAAQYDRDEFNARDHEYGVSLADRGCICFTGCAPCSFCMHPGNPMNQAEDDDAWEEVFDDAVTRGTE